MTIFVEHHSVDAIIKLYLILFNPYVSLTKKNNTLQVTNLLAQQYIKTTINYAMQILFQFTKMPHLVLHIAKF